ncbi:MAG: hypothetical protein HYV33_01425 [Candidatus Kerfeldbacteria bacterium]|nr:hypothetical protein [Candidatus Kerfeldbacteria bacterium]
MTQLSSFSDLLHRSIRLLEHTMPVFLVAVAVPLLLSYSIFVLGVGLLINDVSTVQTYQDLVNIFSLDNPTLYYILIITMVAAVINIIGLLAAPVAAVRHDHVSVKNIFQTTLSYFWSYVMVLLITVVLFGIAIIASFVLVAGIMILIGLVDRSAIDVWYPYLATYIPSLAIGVVAFGVMFAPYHLVEQRAGAWAAIRTSIQVVRGQWVGLLIRELILLLSLSVITFIIQFIPVVGTALGILISTIILTTYNYILYSELTKP